MSVFIGLGPQNTGFIFNVRALESPETNLGLCSLFIPMIINGFLNYYCLTRRTEVMAGKNIYLRAKFGDFFFVSTIPNHGPERLHNSSEAGHEVV